MLKVVKNGSNEYTVKNQIKQIKYNDHKILIWAHTFQRVSKTKREQNETSQGACVKKVFNLLLLVFDFATHP